MQVLGIVKALIFASHFANLPVRHTTLIGLRQMWNPVFRIFSGKKTGIFSFFLPVFSA
jgi:hypothetical protein